MAKFWLEPLMLARSGGFSGSELNEIAKLIDQHRMEFLEKWHEFFGT